MWWWRVLRCSECHIHVSAPVPRIRLTPPLQQASTLVKYLYEKFIEQGGQIRFESKVVDVASVGTSITLNTGEKLTADVIVGADGPFSTVRKAITREGSSSRAEHVDCSGEYLS